MWMQLIRPHANGMEKKTATKEEKRPKEKGNHSIEHLETRIKSTRGRVRKWEPVVERASSSFRHAL